MLNFVNLPLYHFYYKHRTDRNAKRTSKIPSSLPPCHLFFPRDTLSTAKSCENANLSTVQISNVKVNLHGGH